MLEKTWELILKRSQTNLKEKSNLPCMDEEILDVMNGDSLYEERPMNVLDGKKRPKLFEEGNGLRNKNLNNSFGMGKEEGSNSSTVEPTE